jgi:hypothetical protein
MKEGISMSALSRHLSTCTATVFAALLLLPAAGEGAQTFGSRLNQDPNNSGCGTLGACTLVSYIHPTDPNGDPSSAGAPADGVITKFRIRATSVGTPAQVTFRVAAISLPNPSDSTTAIATAAGTGPTVTIPVASSFDIPVLEFPGRLPVKLGQHLAIDNTNVDAVYASSGSKFTYVFAPPLVEGQGPRGSSDVTEELLVAATMEPDADGDGFGDETQDSCPTQAATQGQCVVVTPPPPALALSALKVAAGKVSYTLSTSATVTLALAKGAGGRKVNGRCVRQTARNRKRSRCTRYVTVVGGLAGPGAAGPDELVLPKLNGRKLRAGRYRITVTASDAGKQVTASVLFKIRSKKR